MVRSVISSLAVSATDLERKHQSDFGQLVQLHRSDRTYKRAPPGTDLQHQTIRKAAVLAPRAPGKVGVA